MLTLFIKVKPGSSRDEISIDVAGNWLVRIRERPIEGAANLYLVRFLAKELGVTKSAITIEKGKGSPFKKISLNMSQGEFENRIKELKK